MLAHRSISLAYNFRGVIYNMSIDGLCLVLWVIGKVQRKRKCREREREKEGKKKEKRKHKKTVSIERITTAQIANANNAKLFAQLFAQSFQLTIVRIH